MKNPTKRQAEILSFIRAFTDRWSVPPSFEEIARHFHISTPSVSNMIKTLEARGFITRLPGAARTLRVLLPEQALAAQEPAASRATATEAAVSQAVQMASMLVERLVPALKGHDEDALWKALDVIAETLKATCTAAGASPAQLQKAQQTLRRVASIALGASTETRPGRRLPWWQKLHTGR